MRVFAVIAALGVAVSSAANAQRVASGVGPNGLAWQAESRIVGVTSTGTIATGGGVPAYTELDVRYAWRGPNGLDLSVGGQNLLKRRHAEFIPDLLPSEPVDIERNFYVKAKWSF